MSSAHTSLRTWLVPTVAGLAGLAVGFFLARAGGEAGAETASTSADSSALSAPNLRETTSAFTLDDVRRVVREELDARGVASGAKSAVAASAAAPPPDSAQTAASRASSTLEAALARRSWTEQDSDSLRDDFVAMTSDQRAEWLRQFSVAVNQGRLVPESERSPF